MTNAKLGRTWRDLSVSKKLYIVVGLMAFLITMELFTLKYTVNILSAVRAFVGGEGLWSKAQKNALLDIQSYIIFRDEKYHQSFLKQLEVPLGDREARMELMSTQPDLKIVYDGFLKGRNHPNDIDSMTNLILRYHFISYLKQSIEAWTKADLLIDDVLKIEKEIHNEILKTPKNQPLHRQQEFLTKIAHLNIQVTELADRFTYSLGEASRWVEDTLLIALILLVLIVESTGLFLTFKFSQNLVKTLNELNITANKIGTGDLDQQATVHSKDELGQLAMALNQMAKNLKSLAGEKQTAEKANHIKSLFLANMSHEIRTPLGAILGFVEILKDPTLKEEKRSQYLEIISRAGKSLLAIINDILDLSKVEADKLEINKEVFSLKNLIEDLRNLLQIRCEEKRIMLYFDQAPDMPDYIFSDQVRLRQILINVIGNAIKFTEKGSVTVNCKFENSDLVFLITDTGLGISESGKNELFKPFSQVDRATKKVNGGTGLGLVLTRKIAELLGGDIRLEKSTLCVGSEFSVRIPYQVPENVALPLETATRRIPPAEELMILTGKRILLVEDAPENQILISHILEKYGLEVNVADNGRKALDILNSEDFDIILMDMQMPVLDGYSTTEILRKSGYIKPIISLTAHAMREDQQKCLASGCNEVLTKPVNQAALLHTVSRYLH